MNNCECALLTDTAPGPAGGPQAWASDLGLLETGGRRRTKARTMTDRESGSVSRKYRRC